jgi:hypothetical protein
LDRDPKVTHAEALGIYLLPGKDAVCASVVLRKVVKKVKVDDRKQDSPKTLDLESDDARVIA